MKKNNTVIYIVIGAFVAGTLFKLVKRNTKKQERKYIKLFDIDEIKKEIEKTKEEIEAKVEENAKEVNKVYEKVKESA